MMSNYRKIEIDGSDKPHNVDAGTPPILNWLDIADLVIDETYQRQLQRGNWSAIKRISEQFSWSRFSPVFVSPIEGGKYAIIDGQHRTHAAALCGFNAVPCQIVPMNRGEQAASFAAVNGLVTKVTPLQIYRAALVSGVGWASQLSNVAQAAGCQIMTSNASASLRQPKQIYAIGTMRKLIKEHGTFLITAALKLYAASSNVSRHQELWGNLYLRSALAALAERPAYLSLPDAVSHFSELDFWAITDKADERRRVALRTGVPVKAKHELISVYVLDWIDAKLHGYAAPVMRPAVAAPPIKKAEPIAAVKRPADPQAAIMDLMCEYAKRHDGQAFELLLNVISQKTGIPIKSLPYQLSVLTAAKKLIRSGPHNLPRWEVVQ